MRFRKFFLSLFYIYSGLSFSIDCNVYKLLDHPSLASNNQFWAEYSTLSGNGQISERALGELLKKHNVPVEAPSSAAGKTSATSLEPMRYSASKVANKQISTLSPVLKKNYSDFMTIMSDRSGIQVLYANPGRWRMEKIQAEKGTYSVRLNGGVRVHFRLEKDEVHVLQVNADDVHNL